MKKYLIIRFSSIGDIVLTSPVIRCLKNQLPNAEIHFATKKAFANILEANPNIDKVYTIEKEIDEISEALTAEKYDFVIDLHHNLRTFRLKRKLKTDSAAFPKLNFEKFLLTQFKVNRMPNIHIVDRYFKAVESLGVKNDALGLDYYIPAEDEVNVSQFSIQTPFISFAIGAQFATKRMPTDQLIELIGKVNGQIVLLGGKEDQAAGEAISKVHNHVINLCGKLRLNESASIIQQSAKMVTHDTGLMHIASAFHLPIVSIWGNTTPDFGMYPYLPQDPEKRSIHEVMLSCRPCSKIGYQSCPKKHFNCMRLQQLDEIANAIQLEN